MDLTLTEEQLLLKQSAERYLAERYSFADRLRYQAQPGGWDPGVWADFAQFGWLSLPFPVEADGLGAGAIEMSLLGQAFGTALVVEPYLPTVVLSGLLICELGNAAQRSEWLGPIMAGNLQFSLAHEEAAGRHGPAPIGTEARRRTGGWLIRGSKALVLGGAGAHHFLVSAMLVDEGNSTALFCVPRATAGLAIRTYELIDGTRAAELRLEDVAVSASQRLSEDNSRLGLSSASADPIERTTLPRSPDRRNHVRIAIDRAVDRGIVFCAAMASGSMRAVLDATVAYTKTRQQFGQPLAANQVIKHRLVDMAIACEEASAIALRAALLGDHGSALAAKLKVARGAKLLAEQSIQLHGGMGVTEELNIGAYFKSLLTFELLFGSARRYGSSQFSLIRQRAKTEMKERLEMPRSAA